MSVTALFLLFPFSQAFSFLFLALPRIYVSQAFVTTTTLVKVAVTSMVPNPVVSCTAIIIMVSSSSLLSPLPSFPASLSRKITVSSSASQLFQHYSISFFCFLTAELFILSSVAFLIFEKSLLSLNSSSQFLCSAAALGKNSSAFLSACTSLSSSSWNPL